MSSQSPQTRSYDDTPDYLGTLGLDRAPFLDQTDDSFFYADPILMQRLDLLQHLTQFGDMLCGVTGPVGCGKTTLLQQFVLRGKTNWRICHIDAAHTRQVDEIFARLADSLGLESHSDPARTRAGVLRQCQALQHNTQIAVLLIDNAEQLPNDSLATLLDLAGDPKQTLKLLRVILFGEPSLEAQLTQAGLHSPQQPLLHKLEVPLFDEQQTASYLMYRLAVAGYSGDSPFSLTEIRALHKSAHGLPAKLNVLAHETLMERATRIAARNKAGEEDAEPRSPAYRPSVLAGFAAGLALIAIGIYLVQSGQLAALLETAPSKQEQALQLPPETLASVDTQRPAISPEQEPEQILESTPENTQQTEINEVISANGATPATPDTANPDTHTPDTPTPETPDAAALGEASTEVPAVPDSAPTTPQTLTASETTAEPASPDQTSAPAQAQTQASPAADTSPTATPAATEQTEPAAIVAVKPASPAQKPATANNEPGVEAGAGAETNIEPHIEPGPSSGTPSGTTDGTQREAWLLERPTGHFTLQILGVRDEASLRNFIKRNPLPAPVAYFRTDYKGADWWVLVQGDYPDKTAARAGVDALPTKVRQGKPWPRSFATVQDDIRKVAP